MSDLRGIQRALEEGAATPESVFDAVATAARESSSFGVRALAGLLLGSIAGRAYDAPWAIAERAAFVLLDVARDADAPAERVVLLQAIGRGFRNAWLMPYVHSRLFDEEDSVVEAAISAAGGLAFPALEETVAATFLDPAVARPLRIAAIAALGRMGADSAAERIAAFVDPARDECPHALAALTEIRSRAGCVAARALLDVDPANVAAMTYLAEVGDEAARASIRALSRDEDAEVRLVASYAWRAFEAERKKDPDERILAALTESDRAVRSVLARRLRTLPTADVLARAEVLLADDPRGVIQVIAEVRTPEVTRLLLRIASDESADVHVRSRAAGSIEADEAWERDALVDLIKSVREPAVRVAAMQTLGAFAAPAYVLEKLSALAEDDSPLVRGAVLWALQLSARPRELAGKDRQRAEAIVRRALDDVDPGVRRRAAYVAGNLDSIALVPDLASLARREEDNVELRIAAFAALGDIGVSSRFADLVHLWNREDDPRALWAASRALERALLLPETDEAAPMTPRSRPPPSISPRSAPSSIARVNDRLPKLLASADPRVRAAAARVAGLAPGIVPAALVVGLAHDPSPRVREKAIAALGRVLGAAAEDVLMEALNDAEPAVRERAAEALITIDSAPAFARVVVLVATTSDRAAALRITRALPVRSDDDAVAALSGAVARVDHDDPIYELLLALKLAAIESARPTRMSAPVEDTIAQMFPTWAKLRDVRGFVPLAKSLRTAEMLFLSTQGGHVDSDQSAAIVLWMKSLEGYLHAWLAPRLRSLQDRSGAVFELAERILGGGWNSYQRWLGERWQDPVVVGTVSVELPLRSVVNALRDLQERRGRHVDQPMSVTEWARIMLFFALDHPAGPKNHLAVTCRDADRMARLAHRLHVLAQVRNLVTHRAAADAATVDAFRTRYYAAFEDLTAMA